VPLLQSNPRERRRETHSRLRPNLREFPNGHSESRPLSCWQFVLETDGMRATESPFQEKDHEELKTLYTAEVTSEEGREGRVRSLEGDLDLDLKTPPQLEGENEGTGPNPEELYAAAYSACFHSALKNAAEKAHVDLKGSSLTARVSLNENANGDYELGVELRANMPGVDPAIAERLMQDAHQTCPYSKAVRGNVDVKLSVN
jgi:lipoyl-dependent peroxiredoxin